MGPERSLNLDGGLKMDKNALYLMQRWMLSQSLRELLMEKFSMWQDLQKMERFLWQNHANIAKNILEEKESRESDIQIG